MIASDIMSSRPVTVAPTTSVREAARLLQTLDVRHLPVVDDEGTLVGMISDRDLRAVSVPYLVAGELAGTLDGALGASVASLMSGDVISVESEDDVALVVELMLEHKIGAVPVVDGDGALVGIVSYVDVLREMPLDGAQA